MLSKTDSLLSELQQWCDAEHGRRSELARILGVKAQTVSNWLTRKNTPSSEATLILIEFLENPEKFRKPGRGLK
jgi:DNA-binding transcriptional regulator YiaG